MQVRGSLIVLTLVLLINEIKLEDKCNMINMNGQWYTKVVLLTNSGRPHNLLMHKSNLVLFYSFSILETYLYTGFQVSTYKMKTKETKVVDGVAGACAIAIDQTSGQVFIGGSEGIYTYNLTSQSVDYFAERNMNIWSLFFYKYLFYISYPEQKLHLKTGKHFTKVKEFQTFEVDHFYASAKLIYFANKTGLYRFDRHAMMLTVVREYISVRQITEDNSGVVYVCTNLGVFSLDYRVEGMTLFVDSRLIHGMAFDGDKVILSDGKSIFKLVSSDFVCAS